jgi:endonuclease/exonuclease/phosphatase family metal-dependent hydrolase
MKIAVYNSMYSLNGKSLLDNITGHWAVHYQGNVGQIRKRTNIDRTIEIIKKSEADIIGICEIIEGQEKELTDKLLEGGYANVIFGDGHKTKFNHLRIKVAVASKFKMVDITTKDFPTLDELGGGGGFVSCYLPEQNINVLCIHFAIMQNKELYSKQIIFLQNFIKTLEGGIVLLGDFNKSYDKIGSFFPDLQLASDRIRTCSITPVFKLVHFRDDDHILVRDLKTVGAGYLSGYSDHRLIYANIN